MEAYKDSKNIFLILLDLSDKKIKLPRYLQIC